MSPLQSDPSAVRDLINGVANKSDTMQQANSRIRRLGMSPRQQQLNHLWSWYRCDHYSARRVDWAGREILDPIEHEAIASAGFLPAGFYDGGGQTLPIKFRKPTAPYALVKVIVDRFTGLLFSERNHPVLYVEDDTDTHGYVNALAEASRLWPAMIQARTFGGATGTVCAGFQFIDGTPQVEVHDPRWCMPKFRDRHQLVLSSLEKRYMYPQDERDPETGEYGTVWYWYRRIIDEQKDVLFQPALVGDGEEPVWVVETEVQHNLGFCPVVWVQNMPVQDDVDGDSDCHGIYDMVEAVDGLLAQANRGVLANCDPTLLIRTDAEMGEVRKGSDNAIKLPQDGDAKYVEIAGTGPKAAMELADALRKLALEVAQCVLEHPDMSVRTATEIERLYSAMIAKADVLREQYGQKAVVPLMNMMLRAARKLGTARVNPETGVIQRDVLELPKRKNPDGTYSEQKLGPGGAVRLRWPRYFEVTLTDVAAATTAAVNAKQGGLIDQAHAVQYAAEYFGVEDIDGMRQQIERERAQQRSMEQQSALSIIRNGGA